MMTHGIALQHLLLGLVWCWVDSGCSCGQNGAALVITVIMGHDDHELKVICDVAGAAQLFKVR
jgi:hypothetical protein